MHWRCSADSEVSMRSPELAGMMRTHHTQGMAKVRSLQGKTKIELKDNELTTKASTKSES